MPVVEGVNREAGLGLFEDGTLVYSPGAARVGGRQGPTHDLGVRPDEEVWRSSRAGERSTTSPTTLSPLGVLYDEPRRLLLDDLSETTQAASILALIGSGCHRTSEIAGRLEKPATSLARPLGRLLDLSLVRRDVPFGSTLRESKRTAYRLDHPFLRFWFRFVDPERSRLEAGQVAQVAREVKWSRRVDWRREEATLRRKVANLPLAQDREVCLALWTPASSSRGKTRAVGRISAQEVLASLR